MSVIGNRRRKRSSDSARTTLTKRLEQYESSLERALNAALRALETGESCAGCLRTVRIVVAAQGDLPRQD